MKNRTRVPDADVAAAVVMALFGALLLASSFFPAPPAAEPHTTHQRPATAEESLQRQGDRLMEDMQAYRESGR